MAKKEEQKKMTWYDITLGQFKQIEKIQREHPDDSAMQIMKYIYGDDVEYLPITEYAVRMNELQFLSEPVPTPALKLEYKINGTVYALDITPADLTTAQFIDSQNYIKDGGDVQNLLSVYLIPKGKRYAEDYDIEKVKKDVLSLPIPEVMAICSFFQKWLVRYVAIIRRYLNKQLRKGKADKETLRKVRELMDKAEKNIHGAFFLTSSPTVE